MIRNKPPNLETKFNRVKKMLEKISTFEEWSRFLENVRSFFNIKMTSFKDVEKTVALFTVPWCGSCKILAKKLKTFSDENSEEKLQFTVIDADSIPEGKNKNKSNER